MGPDMAEMEFTERSAEPVAALMMDKTKLGTFYLPIFKTIAKSLNTAGLVIDPACHHGFIFEVWDIVEHKKVFMKFPEEIYEIIAALADRTRYSVNAIYSKNDSSQYGMLRGKIRQQTTFCCKGKSQPIQKKPLPQASSNGKSQKKRGFPTMSRAKTAKDFQVLFCYNSSDLTAVIEIGKQLKQRGIMPWMACEQRPGTRWVKALQMQVRQIGAAAVFIGKSGPGPWQELEIEALLKEYIKRGFPVIPVILPDCIRTPKLPIFLEGLNYVDFRKPNPNPLNWLIFGITGERDKS
jgi:Fructose-1,6-bisphosphatase/TIR domain